MRTVTQQVKHLARTIRWFRDGAFGPGFDMDFQRMEAELQQPATLEEARRQLDDAYDDWIALLETQSADALAQPLPPNHIFGEMPRSTVILAGTDHTAHHRGALSVYLRLLGITPAMVYEP